jgi:hypothetical protein
LKEYIFQKAKEVRCLQRTKRLTQNESFGSLLMREQTLKMEQSEAKAEGSDI